MRVVRLARRLAVSIAVFAAALVALELAASRWFPVGGAVYRLDAELLHDARPNARRIQPMPRDTLGEGDRAHVLVTTGAEGFRGRSLDGGGDRPRVLVVGDSLVMAENVPFHRTFVERLGRELETLTGKAEHAIEMVNAGRSGYGPDQALLLLERVAAAVEPDLVVFVVCAHNDLGDLARNKLFWLEGGELVRRRPRVAPRIERWFADVEQEATDPTLLRILRFVRRGPVLAEVLGGDPVPLFLAALQQQWEDASAMRRSQVDSLFEDVYDVDVALGRPAGGGEKGRLLTAVSARARRCETEPGALGLPRPVPVRFVVVPSAVDVCPGFGIRVDDARWPAYDRGRLQRVVVDAVAAAGGAPVLDLGPYFLGLPEPDRHFVGGTDIHWNALGQGAAAIEVARALAQDASVAAALGR